MQTENKKIIIFGGGKIGRSFIGQLFSSGGYEVVFVDISLPVINELNKRGKYEVVIKSDTDKIIIVKNVRGVDARDKKLVAKEISDASILAVSVGLNALPHIIPLIADGLKERYELNRKSAIDIIIAENMRNASQYFSEQLSKYLPEKYPLSDLVGLVETSIGKMVPIMPEKIEKEDALRVFAEPYNTLILDKKAFINPIPDINGLSPKENMKAWVDRKLFIHNLGHAATAYRGFFYDSRFQYVWEALEVPRIFSTVRDTMLQAAALLLKKYPDEFTTKDLTDHVDDLLSRFRNKALGDTIYRVGCDLLRKLGPEDRLAGAIRLAVALDMPYDKILKALIARFEFRAKDEKGEMHPSDIQFTKIYEKGVTEVLKKVCGFDETNFPQIIIEGEQMANKLHLLRDY
ncbi:MAG: mannitol-1-phosphate 5-dehydrogenase [Bacteroidales bacterium]|nr:mannitol-1-phosphate 5-dehydrogenase [Bacteroidales bacterium]